MKNGKKLLTILLILGMVVTMLPGQTYAAMASGTTPDTQVATPEEGTVSTQISTKMLAGPLSSAPTITEIIGDTVTVTSTGDDSDIHSYKWTPAESGYYRLNITDPNSNVDIQTDMNIDMTNETSCSDGTMLKVEAGKAVYFQISDEFSAGESYTITFSKQVAPSGFTVQCKSPLVICAQKISPINFLDKELNVPNLNFNENSCVWNNDGTLTLDSKEGIEVTYTPDLVTPNDHNSFLKSGTYELQVSYLGSAPQKITVTVQTVGDIAKSIAPSGTSFNLTQSSQEQYFSFSPTESGYYFINAKVTAATHPGDIAFQLFDNYFQTMAYNYGAGSSWTVFYQQLDAGKTYYIKLDSGNNDGATMTLSTVMQRKVTSVEPKVTDVDGVTGTDIRTLFNNLKYTLTYDDGNQEDFTFGDYNRIGSKQVNGINYITLTDLNGTTVSIPGTTFDDRIAMGDYNATLTCQNVSSTLGLTAHVKSADSVAIDIGTTNTIDVTSDGTYQLEYFKYTPSTTGYYTMSTDILKYTEIREYSDNTLSSNSAIFCGSGTILKLTKGSTVYFTVRDLGYPEYFIHLTKTEVPTSIKVLDPLPPLVEGVNTDLYRVFNGVKLEATYADKTTKQFTVGYESNREDPQTPNIFRCNDGITLSLDPTTSIGYQIKAGTYNVDASILGCPIASFVETVKSVDEVAQTYTCGNLVDYQLGNADPYGKILVVKPTKTDWYKMNCTVKSGTADITKCYLKPIKPAMTLPGPYHSGDTMLLMAGNTYYYELSTAQTTADVSFGLSGSDGVLTPVTPVTPVTPAVAVTGVTLDQSSLELAKGSTAVLKATVAPSNAANKNLTWSSSNTSVATVAADGTVTGKKNGTAVITVTTADGNKTATCSVKVVTHATKVITTASANIVKGKTLSLSATMTPSDTTDQITWSSSNTKVATVSSNGKVTAKGLGSATITATATGGKKATCKITVVKKSLAATSVKMNKSKATINAGTSVALTATISPKKTTDTVTWSTSNKKLATVDKNGIVTGIKGGKVKITAKTTSGKTAVCTVTIKVPSVTVSLNKTAATVKVKKTIRLKATIGPKGSTDSLTWSSSNKKCATVSKDGTVKGLKKGTTTITVRTSSGKTATCKITVKK